MVKKKKKKKKKKKAIQHSWENRGTSRNNAIVDSYLSALRYNRNRQKKSTEKSTENLNSQTVNILGFAGQAAELRIP